MDKTYQNFTSFHFVIWCGPSHFRKLGLCNSSTLIPACQKNHILDSHITMPRVGVDMIKFGRYITSFLFPCLQIQSPWPSFPVWILSKNLGANYGWISPICKLKFESLPWIVWTFPKNVLSGSEPSRITQNEPSGLSICVLATQK